ncbi:uncharacterized protein LOC106753840 [Vigna radiata var. radiata]|uniref:Uncharacterized protein LOC106753840 n=1 Tax=Vigna radiata var. radiata TaxID=3916 RepID=A0A1S3TBQ8_VIGRR|nr:uncharacterized protein LOC106753840 [Vigna radiata var. radiata]
MSYSLLHINTISKVFHKIHLLQNSLSLTISLSPFRSLLFFFNMNSKSPLQFLLILLLALSFVMSSAAVQTRRLLPNKENLSAQISSDKGVEELRSGEDLFDLAEEFMERRIDFENNDYPGTGANNRHDPKTPGTP